MKYLVSLQGSETKIKCARLVKLTAKKVSADGVIVEFDYPIESISEVKR